MERLWKIQPALTDRLRALFPELDPLILQLLVNRGLTTQAQIDEFLYPDYGEDIHDPGRFRFMAQAVKRITQAIDGREPVVLFGDYDADGVCAVSLLATTLRALGLEPTVYLPDRFTEGYGLNRTAVASFIKQGTKLLITCDCGTSNVAEIAQARKAGVDVIVVDHHQEPPALPEATVMLNPALPEETYPWRTLCATGVAFKLACALLRGLDYGRGRLAAPLPVGWEKWLLDYVAVGTVADMMPLLGENRTLVKHGLTVLRKSPRPGFRALARTMGTPLSRISSGSIAFQVAPRLNAAGRLRHARTAYTLLTTNDQAEADTLARELNTTNGERQRLTERITDEALEQVTVTTETRLVVAVGNGWSSGVIGLVAGRLKETFHRPALAIGHEGNRIIGSGRSVQGFDITQALTAAQEHLSHFGGHAMACGFTVRSHEHLEPFITAMEEHAAATLKDEHLTPLLTVDAALPLERVTWELANALEQFEPYGAGAPHPSFVTTDLRLLAARPVGADGRHVRLRVSDGVSTVRSAIGFQLAEKASAFAPGDRIDLAYHVETREWNGSRELQLKLIDLRPTNA